MQPIHNHIWKPSASSWTFREHLPASYKLRSKRPSSRVSQDSRDSRASKDNSNLSKVVPLVLPARASHNRIKDKEEIIVVEVRVLCSRDNNPRSAQN